MQVFFQGNVHERHAVLPFVAVDADGNWGVWYSDDRQGCSFGPFYGKRANDPLASWRALQIFDAFLAESEQCTAELARACWDLGYSLEATGPSVDEVRAVLSNAHIARLRAPQDADMDAPLLHVVENDLPISMLGIYNAAKEEILPATPLIQACCSGAFLLVHGELTPTFARALGAVRGGRSGGTERVVRDYIAQADAMLANHLVSLESSFSKINKMLPGTEAATATVKPEGGLLKTITARFRRSDVISPGATQATDLRKEIGMQRIACGESLTAIHQNFSNQHPYADMKLPNYHKSLMRFTTGLLTFSEKLSDYVDSHELADDVKEQTEEVRRNLDELRTWLNMTVSAEMPGVYVLSLPGFN